MNTELTELVFILDRSGSMGGLESDTIGGFNGMLAKQKAQGKKVTAGDERCLHAARENLYGELAVSLGIEKNDVERYIMEKMEDKITG